VGVNIPIFAGGAEKAALERAELEIERQKTVLAELKAHIGFEIRAALLDLSAAGEQVNVNKSAMELASQQLTQAKDRFEAGVTDTLEVVQAQQGLADANDFYITSLYAYSLAKARLARAMGATEQNLANWAAGGGR
jgi:outer membrane protein TolC